MFYIGTQNVFFKSCPVLTVSQSRICLDIIVYYSVDSINCSDRFPFLNVILPYFKHVALFIHGVPSSLVA